MRLSDFAAARSSSTSIPRQTRPGAPPRRAASATTCPTTTGRRDRPGRLARPGQGRQEVPRRQELNFRLLADEDHAICEAYGVWVEKSMYGRTYWGAQRSTFVIDEDGVVAHVVEKVSPKTHDEEVLAKLDLEGPRLPCRGTTEVLGRTGSGQRPSAVAALPALAVASLALGGGMHRTRLLGGGLRNSDQRTPGYDACLRRATRPNVQCFTVRRGGAARRDRAR